MEVIKPKGALPLDEEQERRFRRAHDALNLAEKELAFAAKMINQAADLTDNEVLARKIRNIADTVESRASETKHTRISEVDRALAGDDND